MHSIRFSRTVARSVSRRRLFKRSDFPISTCFRESAAKEVLEIVIVAVSRESSIVIKHDG